MNHQKTATHQTKHQTTSPQENPWQSALICWSVEHAPTHLFLRTAWIDYASCSISTQEFCLRAKFRCTLPARKCHVPWWAGAPIFVGKRWKKSVGHLFDSFCLDMALPCTSQLKNKKWKITTFHKLLCCQATALCPGDSIQPAAGIAFCCQQSRERGQICQRPRYPRCPWPQLPSSHLGCDQNLTGWSVSCYCCQQKNLKCKGSPSSWLKRI